MKDKKIAALSRLLYSDKIDWDEMREGIKRLNVLFELVSPELTAGRKSIEIIEFCNKNLSPFEEISVSVIPEHIPYHYDGSPFVLEEGKIITIDCAIRIGNLWADGAYSWGVGSLDLKRKKLLDTAWNTFKKAWEGSTPGESFSALCDDLAKYVQSRACVLVPGCGGHGIGINLHQESDYIYSNPEKDSTFPFHGAYTVEPVVACDIEGDILSAYFEKTRIPRNI